MMRFIARVIVVLTALCVSVSAWAQQPNCAPKRDLLPIPEIKSKNGKLQGVVILSNEQRSMSDDANGTRCASQQLRFFKGYSTQESIKPWPSTGDILPGPTLRARVGELVEIAFLNQIDTSKFPNSLDQGEKGKTGPCDQAFAQRQTSPDQSQQIYPNNPDQTPGDTDPNCLHGSSTANLHFHGTHTTPSTTGDNVFLFIRPALRNGGQLMPDDAFVLDQANELFKYCEANGPPTKWEQMPDAWRTKQKELLQKYDWTAPYKGVNGGGTAATAALPLDMQLWPPNEDKIKNGQWPQYSIGGFPYCFALPAYDPAKVQMGQAPGTHWYHAHKHGSTALNVGNGMTGALVIEGAYDDSLRNFYKETSSHKNWGLVEQVLVIQQLETALNLLSGGTGKLAPLSVNGRLAPVVTMKPNQVQLWRIVNGAARTFVAFDSFGEHGLGGQTVSWRQTAQDGVQFSYPNYLRFGAVNAKFNLASGNRADLLVKAPAQEGDYALKVDEGVRDVPDVGTTTLLTVRVKADANKIDPAMDFITAEQDFPKFPPFLSDITGPFPLSRLLLFNTSPKSGRRSQGKMPLHLINGKLFQGDVVNQTMTLNTTEEWTMYNLTVNIAHPFHIHINPFQITEVFQPNTAPANDPKSQCYADPTNPDTWKPCTPLTAPYVWWDVFAIPTARADRLSASVCFTLDKCPADIKPFTSCGKGGCTVTIPGHFKMRSRFADYPGQFVLHCHILAHEDRGMMQLVEVALPRKNTNTHH